MKLIFLLAFSLCLMSQALYANDKSRFTIGVQQLEYLPYSHIKHNEYRGVMRIILDKFAQEHGYRFVYEHFPINDLYRNLKTGRIDFKMPDHPNWAKHEKKGAEFIYSRKGIPAIDGVVTLNKNQHLTAPQLRSVGKISGFTLESLDRLKHRKEIKVYEGNSLKQLLGLLSQERINGVYCNAIVARHFGKNLLGTDFLTNRNLPFVEFEYRISTIRYKKVVEQFDVFLKRNKAWLDALYKEHDIQW